MAEDAVGERDKGHEEFLEQVRLVMQRGLVWPRWGAPPLRLRGSRQQRLHHLECRHLGLTPL